MKLESQVCSLELAKQLKELGVKRDSLFYWQDMMLDGNWGPTNYPIGAIIQRDKKGKEKKIELEKISAFTVAELGEMLPDSLLIEGFLYSNEFFKMADGRWLVGYQTDFPDRAENKHTQGFVAETEADARARMLIWLIENGYLKESK